MTDAKQQELEARMRGVGVQEKDLRETFVREGGPGGQRRNKTATCVILEHVPTGVVVRCQSSRTQILNRFLARRMLVAKLEVRMFGSQSPAAARIERLRKRKQKRRQRARKKLRGEAEGNP